MEPVTHALTSLALARSGFDKTTRLATPILVVSSLAADLDLASYAGGAGAFLRTHRALGHSLVGSSILAVFVAAAFCFFTRRSEKGSLEFRRVLLLCALGAAVHLLLDLLTSDGAQLFWPFHKQRYAWDFVAEVDPWILVLLASGLLVPALLRLVSEEIGERKKGRGPQRGAIVALALLALYLGGRGVLHAEAVNLLLSREYHGAVPLGAGAYPSPSSVVTWRGVVATSDTFEVVDVPLGPGGYFDPDHSRTYYKPEASPVLEAARRTRTAQELVVLADFPLAILEPSESGYHFELRDLRFPSDRASFGEVIAIVELDHQLRVTRQDLRFYRPDGNGP
jgi:membrane-bound metal-dependent hydrolase YbcI (DUF457 family)